MILLALVGLTVASCKTVEYKSDTVAVPISGGETSLAATVFYPSSSKGPFPLAILNHGDPGRKRSKMGYWIKTEPINALVQRGFAVMVPIRQGYGATGGSYSSGIGSCDDPDFYFGTLNSGEDIVAAINYAKNLPLVDSSRILLIGHSAGGIAVMAAASLHPKGVLAVVNFSGGRGSGRSDSKYGEPCYPERMAAAISDFTKEINVPELWYYVENDSFFGPRVAKTWFNAFKQSGGVGELVIDPPYGSEGHFALMQSGGASHWGPALDSFLKKYNFPIE